MPSNNDKPESREAKKRRKERERLQRKRATPGYVDAERERDQHRKRERDQERQADPQGYEAKQMERNLELSRRQMNPEYRAQKQREADQVHGRDYRARKRGDQEPRWSGRRPVVVELEVPQLEGGPSGASLPSFSPYAGQGVDVPPAQDEAQAEYLDSMFGNVDTEALLHGVNMDEVAEDWLRGPSHGDGFDAAFAAPAPVSAQTEYQVAYSSWAHHHVDPAAQGTSWSAAYPPSNTSVAHALDSQITSFPPPAPSTGWNTGTQGNTGHRPDRQAQAKHWRSGQGR
ncbi:hypothetical protein [Streptomyces sp. NPDC006012]|uniref:hypothetical protein n=1 Tax=Streptomyces sp. NPDC006012 TaxID=3364739 RepID=UPI0036BB8764